MWYVVIGRCLCCNTDRIPRHGRYRFVGCSTNRDMDVLYGIAKTKSVETRREGEEIPPAQEECWWGDGGRAVCSLG